jgi:hypothetical protein
MAEEPGREKRPNPNKGEKRSLIGEIFKGMTDEERISVMRGIAARVRIKEMKKRRESGEK